MAYLLRTVYGQFLVYQTSADSLDFNCADALGNSVAKYAEVIELLEKDERNLNLNPKCEPQLGLRGLYSQRVAPNKPSFDVMAPLWVPNLSDGEYSINEISRRSGIPLDKMRATCDALTEAGLLKKI